jgi:hypothetical protein
MQILFHPRGSRENDGSPNLFPDEPKTNIPGFDNQQNVNSNLPLHVRPAYHA